MIDSALLGVVVGGVIGLSAQLISARYAKQQAWADTRRDTYSRYLETISIGRRRLEEQVRRRLDGKEDAADYQEDRQRIREEAIAGWNTVRLVSRTRALAGAGRELQIRIATLNEMLERERPLNQQELDLVLTTYESDRGKFVEAAQIEMGLRTPLFR